PAGTLTPAGPNRKLPAARSRIAAKTLGPSGRGRHIHSTRPLGAIRQLASQSERNAYSAMGGNELATCCAPSCSGAGAWAAPSPFGAGANERPRSSTRAFLATRMPQQRELRPSDAAAEHPI